MPLGLIIGIGRAYRRKRPSSLDILSSKRAPRGYYKGKNCKPTGFHTRKGLFLQLTLRSNQFVCIRISLTRIHFYCCTGITLILNQVG